MKKIAFYSIKGGVGKSSAAVNIAYLASRTGRRTLLLDLDAQGAASFYLNVEPLDGTRIKSLAQGKNSLRDQIRASDYPGLDVIPATNGLRNLDLLLDKTETGLKPLAARLEKEYDLLIIDCPAQIGTTGEAIIDMSDALLVPIIPSALSLRTLIQLEAFFERKKLRPSKIQPFINMYDGRRKIHAQTVEIIKEQHPACLGTLVPFSSEFEKMGVQQAPLSHYAPHSKAGLALQSLFDEILHQEII